MLITIHFAQTLDGRIATRTGDSQWIGGPESLRLAHQLRADHDAVVVGVGVSSGVLVGSGVSVGVAVGISAARVAGAV